MQFVYRIACSVGVMSS